MPVTEYTVQNSEVKLHFIFSFFGNHESESGLACILIVVGYLLYRENVSFSQILGIIVCMIGFMLINI